MWRTALVLVFCLSLALASEFFVAPRPHETPSKPRPKLVPQMPVAEARTWGEVPQTGVLPVSQGEDPATGVLPVTRGGTCCSSYAVGDILYASPKDMSQPAYEGGGGGVPNK